MAALQKLSEQGDALYNGLVQAAEASPEGLRKVFFQTDIQALVAESVTDVKNLTQLIQELTSHSLLRLSKLDRALCWSTRPRKAAQSISLLNAEEKLIYSHVEDAHQKGVWLRELKKRVNLHSKAVDKMMSKLENAHLIKNVRNVRAPAQKTYMLYHLVPSDDVTGGSFFDAGDLDESLIEELSNLIVFHVRMQSWAETKPKKVKREASPIAISDDNNSSDPAPDGIANGGQARKRKRATADIEDSAPPARKHRSHREEDDLETDVYTQLAYVARSHPYPSAESIHNFITTTDAIRASKAAQLTVAEIQGVIDVLVWDSKLEKVPTGADGGVVGYRTVRGVSFRPPGYPDGDDGEEGDGVGNGLTQAPCGRCPVFELCEEGGPVNAGSCVYWGEWLGAG